MLSGQAEGLLGIGCGWPLRLGRRVLQEPLGCTFWLSAWYLEQQRHLIRQSGAEFRGGEVHGAQACVGGDDGNVNPGRGVPVWVVVPLFRALQTPAVAIGVLPSVNCSLSVEVLICSEQPLVALPALAQSVVGGVLVKAGGRVTVGFGGLIGCGACGTASFGTEKQC